MPSWSGERAIVVGVDGSVESNAALDWAADEARLRGLPLEVVHATGIDRLVAATVLVPEPGWHTGDDITDAALVQVHTTHPGLRVTGRATTGSAAHDLIDASEDADTVVVGAHGRGGVVGLLGSVSLQVAMHSLVPVVVVRPHSRSAGPVVVGVDGSTSARAAVAFGFEQAEARKVPLVVVAAWHVEFVGGAVVTTPGSPQWTAVEDRLAALVEEICQEPRRAHPGVEPEVRVVHGRPADAVVDAAGEAGLVVVGARGRGGFRGLLLGSVSHEVLQRSTCPVAVVRGRH